MGKSNSAQRYSCTNASRRKPENAATIVENAAKDLISPRVWGDRESEFGIIGIGSTFGPIQEAIAQLKDRKIRAKYMQIRTLWPFPWKKVEEFLDSCKEVFVVENNFTGQLGRLIRSQVQMPIRIKNIVKYSSQAFRPQEISSQIQRAVR